MSNEYAVCVGLHHADKTRLTDLAVRDPYTLKELFPDGPIRDRKFDARNPIPGGWMLYKRHFQGEAPTTEIELRCKLAHHVDHFNFIIVFYETLDWFECLHRNGSAEEMYCYNGLWTTKEIVDHGNYKLKRRKTPLPVGALITESKPPVEAQPF